MIIYKLNKCNWPIRTWYCNKLRTSGSNFSHFSRKMVQAQLLKFFKRTEGMIFPWLERHSPWQCKKQTNTSWESKSTHCAMKPIRIQLKCPYNSSNETKNYPCMSFYVFYIHCTSNVLFCISAHGHEAASTNVLLVLYNSA